MKIAYEKKVPDASAFHGLMEGTSVVDEQYTALQHAGDTVVAAYDGEKLVGVGAFRAVEEYTEAAEEWTFVIDPGYVMRDIEQIMKKLV
jgi:hypothetical protein